MLSIPKTSTEIFKYNPICISMFHIFWRYSFFYCFTKLCFGHLYKLDAMFKTACQVSAEKCRNTYIAITGPGPCPVQSQSNLKRSLRISENKKDLDQGIAL